MSLLTERQLDVADAFLDARSSERVHLVVALSGAHAYGFPSPDSDLDLKAIHIAPTVELLGLHEPERVADMTTIVDGVELDYTSNELGPAIRGLLGGNGNYLERILGEHLLRRSPRLEGLQAIAQGAISKRFHHHYRGFAHSQWKRVEDAEAPTAKTVLYVLRTALTGAELLRSGELVVDVRRLLPTYGHEDALGLIERKALGEQVVLRDGDKARWLDALRRAFSQLDEAYASSRLPDEPANADAAEAWLVDARLAMLEAAPVSRRRGAHGEASE